MKSTVLRSTKYRYEDLLLYINLFKVYKANNWNYSLYAYDDMEKSDLCIVYKVDISPISHVP